MNHQALSSFITRSWRLVSAHATRVKHALSLAIALAGVVCAPGWATDKDGNFIAVGAPGCGDLVASQRSDGNRIQDLRVSAWIGGYVSAYNAWTQDTYDILRGSGMAGARLWLTNYCNAHALDDLSKAMAALVLEERAQRQTQRPE